MSSQSKDPNSEERESVRQAQETIVGPPIGFLSRGLPPTPPSEPPSVPAKIPLEPGQRIAGRYQLKELLGVGGMGVVYRAIEEEIEREVALKFIVTAADLTKEEREAYDERFRWEAQALGALPPHPNRVVLYQFGYDEETDLNFIAMEMVQGEPLSFVLNERVISVSQIVAYARQLAQSLEDVHAKGLVHRDLKPENLIVSRSLLGDEQLKLIDFGIVRALRREGEKADTELVIGTARYMAPELFSKETADDPRVDIYAMGVLLYEMVAGRGPFDHLMTSSDDLGEVIRHHLDTEPGSLTSREGVGQLPSSFVGIILKCLAKRPEDRYSDASELLNSLEQLLDIPSRSGAWRSVTKQRLTVEEVHAKVWPVPTEGSGEQMVATAISGSSNLVAATDLAGVTRVWDTREGRLVRVLDGLSGAPGREKPKLGFSPTGRLLAIGCSDGGFWLHDIKGSRTHRLPLGEGAYPLAIAFDARSSLLVVATTAGSLELWDLTALKKLAQLPVGGARSEGDGPSDIKSLTFSPDRQFLIAGTAAGLLFMWHFSERSLSGALKASPPKRWPVEDVEVPLSVVYQDISPDGVTLAVLRAGGYVELWDPHNKSLLGRVELSVSEQPRRVRFSPDSRQLLVAYESGEIILIDVASQSVLDEVRIPRGSAVNVCYLEDGVPIASTARGALVQVWDLLTMAKLCTVGPLSSHLLDVTISPRGDRALVLTSSGHIDHWDLLTGRHLGRQYSGETNASRLDKAPEEGRVIVCAPERGLMALEGLNVHGFHPFREIDLPIPAPEEGQRIENYAISSDRRLVALGYASGDVRIYGYQEPSEPEVLSGKGAGVSALAFSPDNMMLAVGHCDGRLCLWDLPSVQIEWEDDAAEMSPLNFVAFTPSGRLLSVPRGNSIEIWNLEHKKRVALLEGHEGPIRTMVHGLDGRLLLSSSDDGTARLWDLTQQRQLRVLEDHPGPVTAATLDPEMRLLLTTSGEFLSIWRVSDAKLLARCVSLASVREEAHRWAAFTPEGHFIASHDKIPSLKVMRPGSRGEVGDRERSRLFDPRMVALRLTKA